MSGITGNGITNSTGIIDGDIIKGNIFERSRSGRFAIHRHPRMSFAKFQVNTGFRAFDDDIADGNVFQVSAVHTEEFDAHQPFPGLQYMNHMLGSRWPDNAVGEGDSLKTTDARSPQFEARRVGTENTISDYHIFNRTMAFGF